MIEFVTIATIGNATDFGDLDSDSDMGASAASPTRAIHQRALGSSTNICAVNIATQGNAGDFGDTSES